MTKWEDQTEWYKNVNGERIKLTRSEVSAILEEQERRAEKQAKIQYSEDRQRAYGDWREQLDQIFHEGIDAWKETIQAVKDANPKPE